MDTHPDDDRRSTSDHERDRATVREATPAVLALVAVQASLLVGDPDGSTVASTAWSLLPLVPFAWLVWVQVRSLRRSDERQRGLQLTALAVGFGATMVLALAGGLLDGADLGSPAQSLQLTFIGGMAVWLGSLAFLSRPAR